jgi:hypothetical protein
MHVKIIGAYVASSLRGLGIPGNLKLVHVADTVRVEALDTGRQQPATIQKFSEPERTENFSTK